MSSPVPRVRTSKSKLILTWSGEPALYSQSYEGLLVSAGHKRNRNGSWSGGGPFCCVKRSITHSQGQVRDHVRANGNDLYYSNAGSYGTPAFVVPSVDKDSVNVNLGKAADYSLEGYNRTRPGTSKADLLVTVKELVSDGLPSIPGLQVLGAVPFMSLPRHLDHAFSLFKNLGSEYLNVIFGWKPFVNDLRKLYSLYKTIDNQVAQLVRQNGHTVRRRATIFDNTTSTFEDASFNSPFQNNYGGGNPYALGHTYWSRCVIDRDKSWYHACYRYWIPKPTSWQWRAKAKAILFGAYPTPGNLYAAMPWSWLSEWTNSIGGILNALSPSAVDNLVQLYGYSMRHTSHEVRCLSRSTHQGFDNELYFPPGQYFGYKYSGGAVSTSSIYVDEVKARSGGFNPFGPDKISSGFSTYQISVLSALGLTRLG